MWGRYQAFIGGEYVKNVTISGGGIIDGQGKVWWQRSGRLPGHAKTLKATRGRLIQLAYCQDLVVRDITLKDSPFWTLHPYACDNVLIERVKITAPVWSRNTDCIDPDSSTNVLIKNCTLDGGDDQIAIKSGMDEPGRHFARPAANITIDDCILNYGDGISIGSEMSGGVYNVTVRRIKMSDMLHNMRIKSGYGRGGRVSNILFEDIQLSEARHFETGVTAITVDEFDNNVHANASHDPDGWPTIDDVEFRRVQGGALQAGIFHCIDEVPCRGIKLTNVTIKPRIKGFDCKNAFGVFHGVKPALCLSSPENVATTHVIV
jgi:polygalacturonase